LGPPPRLDYAELILVSPNKIIREENSCFSGLSIIIKFINFLTLFRKEMKLLPTLLVVFSLALICSSVSVDSARRLKKHHSTSKIWLDSFFNWRLAYFTVKSTGKQFDFEAKVNENKTGIILAEDGTYANDNTGFIKNVLVFDGKTPVIDFRLVKGCKFNNVDVGTFDGYRFNFDAANFEGKTEGIWRVDVSYRWGAGFVGGILAYLVLKFL
jgi:hypothetical protein